MDSIDINNFPADWEETMMTFFEDPSANASSMGLSDAFCREFTNVPQFGEDLDVTKDLGLQGSDIPAGTISSDAQLNEQFAPQQPEQPEQSLVTTAQLPLKDAAGQCANSIESLFDGPGSPEIEIVEVPTTEPMTPWPVTEIPITPPTSGKRTKRASNQIGKKSTPRSKTSRITTDLVSDPCVFRFFVF